MHGVVNIPCAFVHELVPGVTGRKKDISRAVKGVEHIKVWIPKKLLSPLFAADVEKGYSKKKTIFPSGCKIVSRSGTSQNRRKKNEIGQFVI
jgi:hypothetical protein